METKKVSYGQDVYDSLEEYITDARYKQAVLLNGSWGSGKTWFIKEQFIPVFEKNHAAGDWCFIYLSLYGLKTMQQLKEKIEQQVTQKIFERYVTRHGAKSEEAAKFCEKVWTVSGVLSSAAALAAKTFIPIKDLPEVKWNDLQKVLSKPKCVIYVMDDLERAGIEVNEVLGYINEMTEHENAKVIILANEEEICKEYDFGKISNQERLAKESAEKKVNQKRESYELIKEKTIGLDIAFHVQVDDIYDSLAEKYVEEETLKSYIRQQKDTVLGNFDVVKSQNLRTLIFVFIACDKCYSAIENVYNDWVKKQNEDEQILKRVFDKLVSEVIKDTVQGAILLKETRKIKELTTASKHNPTYWWGAFSDCYSFITLFMKEHRIDCGAVEKTITIKLNDLLDTCQEKNEAYNKLMDWQRQPQVDVEKYLEQVKNEISKKNLNAMYIKNLFLSLINIKNLGINVSLDEYAKAVHDNLSSHLPLPFTVDELYVSSLVRDRNTLDKYNNALEKVYEFVKENTQNRLEQKLLFLVDNEWTVEFKSRCHVAMSDFMDNNKFLAYVDIEKFKQKLEVATPAEIVWLIDGLQCVYNMSNVDEVFKEDISNVKGILTVLKAMKKTGDKVKDWQIQQLEHFLECVKEDLEK